MGILDKLLGRTQQKAAELPFVSTGWVAASWLEPSFTRMNREGYGANAAVFQCVSVLARKYPEALLVGKDARGEELDERHPLSMLLLRPNPIMSWAELAQYIVIYKAIGGQAYLHVIRNRDGVPLELWPYHAGQLSPIPDPREWVKWYEYSTPSGDKRRIPAADVVHLKWPAIDLEQPWLAMPPLRAVAREVDADNEMTRYLYALLRNDATPRTILSFPADKMLGPTQKEAMAAQFAMRHGGGNRGNVGIVEGGATVSRLSLNLQELAMEAMRRIPESRIAGAFGVPAILAGLYVGLEKATYSNFAEARAQLTEDVLMPMWTSDAVELTAALGQAFGAVIEYDTSKVAALQENEDSKYTRLLSAYDSGVLTKNEVRQMIGLPRVGELTLDPNDPGDVFVDDAPAMPETPPPIIDVQPIPPPQLTDEQKARGFKAKRQREDATAQVERRMRRTLQRYFREQADAVLAGVNDGTA